MFIVLTYLILQLVKSCNLSNQMFAYTVIAQTMPLAIHHVDNLARNRKKTLL